MQVYEKLRSSKRKNKRKINKHERLLKQMHLTRKEGWASECKASDKQTIGRK